MTGATSAHLEGLIRLEMKPFELCPDLMDIRIEGSGKIGAPAWTEKPREITRIASRRLPGQSWR